MTEHFSMVDIYRQYSQERERANEAYRQHNREIAAIFNEAKTARIERAKASGFMVTVSLDSVSKMLSVPVGDLQYDYARDLPQWAELHEWLIKHCQGSTMLFEPTGNDDSDSTDSASIQHHTFAPTTNQLKGSYRTKSKKGMLNPGVLPPALFNLAKHEVDVALSKPNSISAWFELAQDATLFKLTWA